MGHLPNRSRARGSNPTLVHFYYLVCFSDLHFLLTRTISGLAFRNLHAGVERLLTLRRTVDSEDRVACHMLAPGTRDKNRLAGSVLRLPRYMGNSTDLRSSSFFSLLKGKFPPSHFPLSLHRPTWG
jgi:hypothetical protein